MKREQPNPKANRAILYVAYAMAALFAAMICYFGFFIQIRSETVINNPYNARLDRFEERVIRGGIYSNDGQVLARTDVGEDGSETRVYPFGGLFAHAVGYSTMGKTGVEALANYYLLSSHVDPMEKVISELLGKKSMGDRVMTTLDVKLQKAASDALGGRKGAVIAMEPDTGKILAMVSEPGYDPNLLTEQWDSLISAENDQAQLLNRASQGVYPPGSVFKMVTLLEYIREHPDDWKNYSFDCDGSYESGEYTISCYHGNAHGHQNIGEAFANSCNGAFAEIGMTLDKEKLRNLTDTLLFNRELPASIAYSQSSFTMGTKAGDWEILQTSIGQGSTQMTPLHVALITAAAANGGILMKPCVIDYIENPEGGIVHSCSPEEYGRLMKPEEAGTLQTAMEMVVQQGTGSALRNAPYTAAGKTGSAEFETGKETHAWFTGYAPAENPQLAVTVIVEEGGSGGKVAGPVARTVFDTFFMERQPGKNMPRPE